MYKGPINILKNLDYKYYLMNILVLCAIVFYFYLKCLIAYG